MGNLLHFFTLFWDTFFTLFWDTDKSLSVSRRTFWEICYTFLHFFGTLFLHFFGTPTKVWDWKRCSRRTSFWETCLHFFTLFGTLFLHFFGTPTKVCLRTGNGVAGGPLFGKLVYTFLHFLGHFFYTFLGHRQKFVSGLETV